MPVQIERNLLLTTLMQVKDINIVFIIKYMKLITICHDITQEMAPQMRMFGTLPKRCDDRANNKAVTPFLHLSR